MNTSLLYFSATDNTKKILKAIAEKIDKNFIEYNITLPENRGQKLIFGEEDFVLVGVPVYSGRIPKFLVPALNEVKGNGARALCIVTYGNREYEDALLELHNLCEDNGFRVIAAGAFLGEHSYTDKLATNRPDAKDLQIAAAFGIQVKEKIECGTTGKLKVRGNNPYVEKPKKNSYFAPITSDDCVACGLCERHCPMGAISKDNYKKIDEEKCIHCCSCIKKCPVLAKSFIQEEFINLKNRLETNFAEPIKMPEIFI